MDDTNTKNGIAARSILEGAIILTREQVAEILTVSPDSVDNLHRVGKLRAIKLGKHNRWLPDHVRAFVNSLPFLRAT